MVHPRAREGRGGRGGKRKGEEERKSISVNNREYFARVQLGNQRAFFNSLRPRSLFIGGGIRLIRRLFPYPLNCTPNRKILEEIEIEREREREREGREEKRKV